MDEEDEIRNSPMNEGSMEDSMDTMQNGMSQAANTAKRGASYFGEKVKSSKMAQRVKQAQEKAAAKAKAVAEETVKGGEKVIRGATTMGAGVAVTGAGIATKAAGAALSSAGQALTTSTAGFAAPIGEAMDVMGQGMQQAGKGMIDSGKQIMEHGKKTVKKGLEQLDKAKYAKPGQTPSDSGDSSPIPKPKIPFIGKKKPKKSRKDQAKKIVGFITAHPTLSAIIAGAIVFFIIVLIVVLMVSSKVSRGKYDDGNLKNVPYVVTRYALDSIEVFPDGKGGFTYGFRDEAGNALTLDETLEKILNTLKENDSNALADLGETDEERKEFLKLLIQAEVATQYPDLTIEGNGTTEPMSGTGMSYVSSGKDYCVATDQANAATVLDEEGLKAAVNNSNMSDQAKQNVLGVIPDLVRLQEEYHVNALFLIAAAKVESTCGTNWDYIDPSTYNWLSVKGTTNGGYVDRNGTSWCRYSSYKEACENWFQLITGSSHYFKAGKYTVKTIAPTYCNSAWGESVTKYMDEFYGWAGATNQREIAAVTNTTYENSPSQSQTNLAQWGWIIQFENLNAYYYEHGYANMPYNNRFVKNYITQDGRDYIIDNNGEGLYIGPGVQLINKHGVRNDFNLNLLQNHGVDVSDIHAGGLMNADAVDKVSQEIFMYKKNEIQSKAAAKGLNLKENQIVALIDISYLNGNCDSQLNQIARLGADSDQLANIYGFEACGENDTPTNRAQTVWKLYKYGKYEAKSGSGYDPTYFGGLPESTDNSSGTGHSGTATAGQVDANGVTITENGNIDFLNYAIDAHVLLREDGFYYNNCGREMPVVKGDSAHYIDCTAYIAMALDYYGRKDWPGYPHQLTPNSLIAYGKSSLETVYEGSASSINEIPNLESGDICVMPGHGQIFYGYDSNGNSVWLNCGGNAGIQGKEGKYGWYSTPILYVFRVPKGSGNTYTARASQVLTGNEDSVQGKIVLKRKDDSGNEAMLEYIDEATFDSLIASNNPDVLNYYTLKKGSSSGTSSSSGNIQISGSETKEKIWNYLIDSGCTEEGAAALMGNLDHESGCRPVCVQGDYLHGNADEYSQNYTNKVDSGEISREDFIYRGPGGGGYGLAQWTATDRKTKFYDYAKSKNASIGDLQTQLEYLVSELSTNSAYSEIWSLMTTSHDLNATCDQILLKFEKPRHATEKINDRRETAQGYYDKYHGSRTGGNNNTTDNSGSNANTSATGLISDRITFSSGGSWEYYLYVPENPDPAKPIVVYQHGRRQAGNTSLEVLKSGNGDHGWAYLVSNAGESFDYYVIEPRIPAETGWFENDTHKLHELVEEVKSKYGINTDNVSLWGFSMGSERIEYNIHAYPGYYSSVVILGRNTGFVQGPANASEFSGMPVVVEYGGGDSYSNSGSPSVANKLKDAGANVLVKSQGNYDHGETLTRAIHDPEVMEFITNGSASSFVSFDNFLFVGDSRYVGIKSELEGFGNNVNVCAVSGSTAEQWESVIDSGSGSVKGTNITLPESASGVSVMLGTNTCQDNAKHVEEVLNKLHARYPSAQIYYNSVYHVGENYWTGQPDSQNATYDTLNAELKTFCEANSWATYIDISDGMYDENGYLKDKDGEGTHATGESRSKLIENIREKIKSTATRRTNNSSSATNPNDLPSDRYAIVVASYDTTTVTSVTAYQYSHTRVISTASGATGPGSQATATPAGSTTTNTTTKFKTTYADYQPALKNHTLYFDFLWALYITTSDKDLVEDLAKQAVDSKVEITFFEDTKITQNTSTSEVQPKIQYKREDITVYEDYFSGTNTTTTTNKIVVSKGCITLANVWNMDYKSDANSYNEFKSKSKETVREKTGDDDKIMKLLRAKSRSGKREGSRADAIYDEYYLLEDMLEDNKKVNHMIETFKYYVEAARKKSNTSTINRDIINTDLFDLSNSQATSTVKVLLYTSLNISESDKEMMYKAVEQMTSGFPDDNANKQRKKYIASVILNRALSSKFPDTVSGVINQTGQFPNLNTSNLDSVTYSDETKTAVDAVIQGGDCSKYSVYFNTPAGAASLDWDNKYTKTINDGNDAENSYSYYTDDEIVEELKKFEVSVAAGTTMPSDTAKKIVEWAEAQVGKTSFYNSYSGTQVQSSKYCASFVQCAYYEAGLGYYGGNAKDLPHPNKILYNSDGTVNYSNIPVGAIIVSEGTPVDGVKYGHVCLYVGNGYVIEAGGDKVCKSPIDDSFAGKGHSCAPFIGWGFAVEDQQAAYEKLVIRVGGGTYAEGWTPNDDATRRATGIEGYYVCNGRQYNVYCQGGNDVWASTPYSRGTYESSACGATSSAIIASSVDPNITPIETGKSCYQYAGSTWGQQTYGGVTDCAALTKALSDAGIRSEWKGCTKEQIIEHLRTGQPVILLLHYQKAGNVTYEGHYVTLLGVNSSGEIFLGDPARHGANTGYYDPSMFTLPPDGVCFVYFD